ncbi:MAG: hypothetical protein Q7J72_03980 [Candidatus Omnitrophota bacterium]|nr:hypothetical protein [Candidatus Omnitrophota bacterium]
MFKKIISLALSVIFSVQTCGFAQVAQLNLAGYLGQGAISLDRFRPAHLRYFSYESKTDNFQILVDKADEKGLSDIQVKEKADELMKYFRIGLSLPNEKFWVNLRPDAPEQIIDPELEKTDIGKVMLEADLNLKKDTSSFTSPQTKEGREYWDKLYKKAGELFGSENITIPTITRPWIVPGEIIVRESGSGAYIYKAALKVMLEQDHLKGSLTYDFKDPRMKELNEYSSQLIRELIIPKLTKEVNRAKRYAALRQVFYSLVLSRWFKERFSRAAGSRNLINDMAGNQPPFDFAQGKQASNELTKLIDSGNLSNLSSKQAWDKTTYFQAYQKSFKEGEYNLSEPVYTPTGQVIRRYMSGGTEFTSSAIVTGLYQTADKKIPSGVDVVSLNFTPDGNSVAIAAASPLVLAVLLKNQGVGKLIKDVLTLRNSELSEEELNLASLPLVIQVKGWVYSQIVISYNEEDDSHTATFIPREEGGKNLIIKVSIEDKINTSGELNGLSDDESKALVSYIKRFLLEEIATSTNKSSGSGTARDDIGDMSQKKLLNNNRSRVKNLLVSKLYTYCLHKYIRYRQPPTEEDTNRRVYEHLKNFSPPNKSQWVILEKDASGSEKHIQFFYKNLIQNKYHLRVYEYINSSKPSLNIFSIILEDDTEAPILRYYFLKNGGAMADGTTDEVIEKLSANSELLNSLLESVVDAILKMSKASDDVEQAGGEESKSVAGSPLESLKNKALGRLSKYLDDATYQQVLPYISNARSIDKLKEIFDNTVESLKDKVKYAGAKAFNAGELNEFSDTLLVLAIIEKMGKFLGEKHRHIEMIAETYASLSKKQQLNDLAGILNDSKKAGAEIESLSLQLEAAQAKIAGSPLLTKSEVIKIINDFIESLKYQVIPNEDFLKRIELVENLEEIKWLLPGLIRSNDNFMKVLEELQKQIFKLLKDDYLSPAQFDEQLKDMFKNGVSGNVLVIGVKSDPDLIAMVKGIKGYYAQLSEKQFEAAKTSFNLEWIDSDMGQVKLIKFADVIITRGWDIADYTVKSFGFGVRLSDRNRIILKKIASSAVAAGEASGSALEEKEINAKKAELEGIIERVFEKSKNLKGLQKKVWIFRLEAAGGLSMVNKVSDDIIEWIKGNEPEIGKEPFEDFSASLKVIAIIGELKSVALSLTVPQSIINRAVEEIGSATDKSQNIEKLKELVGETEAIIQVAKEKLEEISVSLGISSPISEEMEKLLTELDQNIKVIDGLSIQALNLKGMLGPENRSINLMIEGQGKLRADLSGIIEKMRIELSFSDTIPEKLTGIVSPLTEKLKGELEIIKAFNEDLADIKRINLRKKYPFLNKKQRGTANYTSKLSDMLKSITTGKFAFNDVDVYEQYDIIKEIVRELGVCKTRINKISAGFKQKNHKKYYAWYEYVFDISVAIGSIKSFLNREEIMVWKEIMKKILLEEIGLDRNFFTKVFEEKNEISYSYNIPAHEPAVQFFNGLSLRDIYMRLRADDADGGLDSEVYGYIDIDVADSERHQSTITIVYYKNDDIDIRTNEIGVDDLVTKYAYTVTGMDMPIYMLTQRSPGEETIVESGDFFKRVKFKIEEWRKSGASSALNSQTTITPEFPGGIDFRSMNMLIQPMGSFSGLDFSPVRLSSSALEGMDLGKELESLKRMVSSSMLPSPQRLKEYISACIFKGKIGEKSDEFILSMLEVFQLQAEEGIESSAEEREAVVMADTRSYCLPEKRADG